MMMMISVVNGMVMLISGVDGGVDDGEDEGDGSHGDDGDAYNGDNDGDHEVGGSDGSMVMMMT